MSELINTLTTNADSGIHSSQLSTQLSGTISGQSPSVTGQVHTFPQPSSRQPSFHLATADSCHCNNDFDFDYHISKYETMSDHKTEIKAGKTDDALNDTITWDDFHNSPQAEIVLVSKDMIGFRVYAWYLKQKR